MTILSRRDFLSLGVVAAGSQVLLDPLVIGAEPNPKPPVRPLLYTGGGPARGDPSPHSLQGEDLVNARLTPESWRPEIVSDGSKVENPRKRDDGTAIDMRTLLELGCLHRGHVVGS